MMTRNDVIRETARRTDYTIAVCNEIVKEALNVIADELEGHGEVRLANFGRFICQNIAGRRVVLPSGEQTYREPHLEPKFKASETLKRRVRY